MKGILFFYPPMSSRQSPAVIRGMIPGLVLAAVAFLQLGVAADPSYSPDVALITQTRFGLEIELTPGMVYFTYRPVAPSPMAGADDLTD